MIAALSCSAMRSRRGHPFWFFMFAGTAALLMWHGQFGYAGICAAVAGWLVVR